MNRSVAIFFGVLFITGTAAADSSQCAPNFKDETGFFAGNVFKTWADFPDTQSLYAFKKVYAFTAKSGFTITQADKDLGVISSSKDSGSKKSASINILVEESGGGSKVSMTYAGPGGFGSLDDDEVKKLFCDTLAEVDKK